MGDEFNKGEKEVKIDQLVKLAELLGDKKTGTAKEIDGGTKIVVLQRGWVAVGHYFRKGTECRLENASIIRRWGTTEGLPQLANQGPLGETKLEKSVTPIRFHRSAEILTIDCNEDKWKR